MSNQAVSIGVKDRARTAWFIESPPGEIEANKQAARAGIGVSGL